MTFSICLLPTPLTQKHHYCSEPGWGPLSNAFAGTCSWDSLYTRSDEVLAACCETEQDCPGGIPNSCSIECGQVSIEYLPAS